MVFFAFAVFFLLAFGDGAGVESPEEHAEGEEEDWCGEEEGMEEGAAGEG